MGCVIETHQELDFPAGLLGKDIPVSKQGQPLIGKTIPVARYGLPDTKILVRNAGEANASNKGTTVLLANHGVICFGKDEGETLNIAKQLEVECRKYLTKLIPLFGEESDEKTKTQLVAFAKQTTLPKGATRIASLLQKNDDQRKSILFHTSPAVLAVSKKLETLPSYIDDFAQITGTKVVVIDPMLSRKT